jgi:tetratricopeptide (TPR) repeat protein
MQLQLQHNANQTLATAAAFIRGNSPERWLHELDRWGIDLDDLECYVVPESIQTVAPGGLFVIFKKKAAAANLDVINAYGLIGEKLFVPVNTTLIPAITSAELQTLLLWERQVFHPTIGLVGFEAKDALDIATLLALPSAKNTDWDDAHHGNEPMPELSSITVEQPSVDDLMASLKETVDPKNLKDIPKEERDKEDGLKGMINDMKRGTLKGTLNLTKFLNGTGNADDSSEEPDPSMFDKLEDWLEDKIEDLDKKRDDELKRLLNLFDKDSDEALKYAIPLDSPYHSRGVANQSSKLSRRPTDFNLGGVGGGGPVDTWDVDHYYHDLRTKYQQAANREIEKGDFRKAAYIYAHLLGDMHSAANVLKQGKHYREAAALYKEHLKQPLDAAKCLEEGGLYLEAVELYVELEKHEKAGDLFVKLGQTKDANLHYETHLAALLKGNNHLHAAELLNHKMDDSTRALVTLMDGWKSNSQHEACLREYFSQMKREGHKNLGKHVDYVFRKHVGDERRNSFLNTLTHVHVNNNNEAVRAVTRALAYEILSGNVTNLNDVAKLHQLNQFVHGDRLLASDASRFASSFRAKPIPEKERSGTSVMQLDESIYWQTAVTQRQQLIAIGTKDSVVYLARSNWDGYIEYESWPDEVVAHSSFLLFRTDNAAKCLFLAGNHGGLLRAKTLGVDLHFGQAVMVHPQYGLPDGTIAIGSMAVDHYTCLTTTGSAASLKHFTPGGFLEKTIECYPVDGEEDLDLEPGGNHLKMIHHWNYFYVVNNGWLLQISEKGATHSYDLPDAAHLVCGVGDQFNNQVVVALSQGFILFAPTEHRLRVQYGGDEIFGEDVFDDNEITVDIAFTTEKYFVAASGSRGVVFELALGGAEQVAVYNPSGQIVSIVSTLKRREIGFLLTNGKVEVCKF